MHFVKRTYHLHLCSTKKARTVLNYISESFTILEQNYEKTLTLLVTPKRRRDIQLHCLYIFYVAVATIHGPAYCLTCHLLLYI